MCKKMGFRKKMHERRSISACLHAIQAIFTLCLLGGSSCCPSGEDIQPYFSIEKQAEIRETQKNRSLGLKRIACYLVSCEGGTRDTQPQSVKIFNKKGQIEEESYFSAAGTLSLRKQHVYDDADNKVKTKYYDRYNELTSVEQFDDKGYQTLSMRLRRYRKTKKRTQESRYNSEKYIQSMKEYDENERLLSEARYSYYPNGVLKHYLHVYYATEHPTLKEKKRIQKDYSTSGALLRRATISAKKTISQTYKYEYNDQKQPTQVDVFNKNEQLIRADSHVFDDKGLKKESIERYYKKEALISEKKYQYDAKGLLGRVEKHVIKAPKQRKSSCMTCEHTFFSE